jgi:hypothetical protein
LTHETYTNYQTLSNTEKYLKTRSGDEEFFAKYMTIPSYSRGRQIFKGYSSESFSYDIDYVHKGAFYWDGELDASFIVKSAHDAKYLYMKVDISDDKIVPQACDTCLGDRIDIWFDVLPPYIENGDRFAIQKHRKIMFRTNAELGIYCLTFHPGNFLDKKAFVRIGTTDDLETGQIVAARDIKVVSSLIDGGFRLKFKIPFSMLGFDENPIRENEITVLGCTLVYNDIDNKYRPEEETQLASSSSFKSLNPSSYGALLLIPKDYWHGDTRNIYNEEILTHLIENGY